MNEHTDGQIKRDSIFIGLEDINEESTAMLPIYQDYDSASINTAIFSDKNSGLDAFLTAEESPKNRSRLNSLIGYI